MDTGTNKQIPQPELHPVGRVVIDNRGRNVWQWNDNQLDSTTIMLKRLDNAELALEPTRRLRRPGAGGAPGGKAPQSGRHERPTGSAGPELQIEQTFNVKTGCGFDPYNRS